MVADSGQNITKDKRTFRSENIYIYISNSGDQRGGVDCLVFRIIFAPSLGHL